MIIMLRDKTQKYTLYYLKKRESYDTESKQVSPGFRGRKRTVNA